MQRFIIAIAIAFMFPNLASAAQETRKMPPFTAVNFAGNGELMLTIGEEQSLTLDADSDLLHEVTTEVHGTTLEIGRKEKHRAWNFFSFLQWLGSPSFETEERLVIRIKMPRLTDLTMSGDGKVQAEGFDGGDTTIAVSGATHLEGRGRLDNLAVKISGAGNAELGGLVTAKATVSITGAGHVIVQPTQALHADISGMGEVTYIGDPPEVIKNVSGMGRVERQ